MKLYPERVTEVGTSGRYAFLSGRARSCGAPTFGRKSRLRRVGNLSRVAVASGGDVGGVARPQWDLDGDLEQLLFVSGKTWLASRGRRRPLFSECSHSSAPAEQESGVRCVPPAPACPVTPRCPCGVLVVLGTHPNPRLTCRALAALPPPGLNHSLDVLGLSCSVLVRNVNVFHCFLAVLGSIAVRF